MTEGSITKQLIRFALPVMAANLFQQCYNMVDTAIVGQCIGEQALAAVGSAGQLSVFLIYFFIGLSVGAGVVVSHSIGRRDERKVREQVHTAAALALLGGTVLMAVGIGAAPVFLGFLNIPDEVMCYAVPYIRCYFLGTLPLMIYNMGSSILRAAGDSKTGLYCLAAGGVINVGLDFLFVTAFSWGVRGAALATAAAQCVSALLVTVKLLRTGESYRLRLREIRLLPRECLAIIRVGVPAGLQSVLVSFSNVIVYSQVNTFGLTVMAGFTGYMKLDGLLYMPIEALSLAVSSFVGQNFGAGKRRRAEQGTRLTLGLAVALTVLISALMLVFAAPLLGIFNSNAQVAEQGIEIMRLLLPLYFLYAVNQTLSGAMRGLGNASGPMMITLFTMCGLRICWILGMLRVISDVRIIYVSYPLTWAVTTVSLIICYVRTKKKKWR